MRAGLLKDSTTYEYYREYYQSKSFVNKTYF